jgi:hypothetical protein
MQYDLYIQVVDGQPVNHPALKENLLDALGEVPTGWEPFIRIPAPYQIYKKLASEIPEYKKVDGVWLDLWTLIDLTAEEKAAVQQETKDAWANRLDAFNFTAWVYNENTNVYEPPIPRPLVGQYRWCGPINNWREAPLPTDLTKSYKFDFVQWIYVEV